MIREEVEKLRGYLFTEEEMKEIINPALLASKEPKSVKVKTEDLSIREVPTMKELNDFKKAESVVYRMLDERITKLEAKLDKRK